MKKFAAIFAAVILTLSVVMVSASAKLFVDSDPVYQYSGLLSTLDSSTLYPVHELFVYRSGELVFSYSFDTDVSLSRSGIPGGIVSVPQFRYIDPVDGSTVRYIYCPVELRGSDTLVVNSFNGSLTFGTKTTVVSEALVGQLSDSVFSAGSSLLAFVQSSWLTLVALGSFLVVLCVGVVRRLVKGV